MEFNEESFQKFCFSPCALFHVLCSLAVESDNSWCVGAFIKPPNTHICHLDPVASMWIKVLICVQNQFGKSSAHTLIASTWLSQQQVTELRSKLNYQFSCSNLMNLCGQVAMNTVSHVRESGFESWSRWVDSAFHTFRVGKMRSS